MQTCSNFRLIPPFASRSPSFHSLLYLPIPLCTYLENKLLLLVERIPIYSCPRFAIDCSPLAASPTPRHPTDQVTYLLCWTLERECVRTLWMGAPSWERGDRILRAGTGSVSWLRQRKRKDVIRGEMRRRREDKEDDPFTALRCQHAQSKLMCTARRWKVNPLLMYIFVYLLYLLFQENKSFGVRTICIHPLM